jgi:hypothetical protein
VNEEGEYVEEDQKASFYQQPQSQSLSQQRHVSHTHPLQQQHQQHPPMSEATQEIITQFSLPHHHQPVNVFPLKQPPSRESAEERHFNDEEYYSSQTPLIR